MPGAGGGSQALGFLPPPPCSLPALGRAAFPRAEDPLRDPGLVTEPGAGGSGGWRASGAAWWGSVVNALVSALAGNSLCLGPQGALDPHQRFAGLCRAGSGAEVRPQQVQDEQGVTGPPSPAHRPLERGTPGAPEPRWPEMAAPGLAGGLVPPPCPSSSPCPSAPSAGGRGGAHVQPPTAVL